MKYTLNNLFCLYADCKDEKKDNDINELTNKDS
jgi:hypothetical protein